MHSGVNFTAGGGGGYARVPRRGRERERESEKGGGVIGSERRRDKRLGGEGRQGPPTCSIECSVSHSAERARSGKAVGVRQQFNVGITPLPVLPCPYLHYTQFFLRMKKSPLNLTFKRLEFFFLSLFVSFPFLFLG